MRRFENRRRFWLCAFTIALCFGATCAGVTQEPGPPPPDAMQGPPPGMQPTKMDIEKEIANMTKRYGLTDAQKEQIRPILVAQQQKFEEVFQDASLAPEERFPKLRAIHDEQVAKVSEILTDSQRAKYQKDQKRMGHGSGPDGPPPPLDGMGGGPPGL